MSLASSIVLRVAVIVVLVTASACGDVAGQGAVLGGAVEGDTADGASADALSADATGAAAGDVQTADTFELVIDPIVWDASLSDGWIEPDPGECDASAVRAFVQYTPDGDTMHLTSGERVRLLGVSASELSNSECYSTEGKDVLIGLAPKGTEICLIPDPKADNKDVYDRLLRYVFVPHPDDGRWVLANARIVRTGRARAYTSFLWGLRFRNEIVAAEFDARTENIGGWAACGWQPR